MKNNDENLSPVEIVIVAGSHGSLGRAILEHLCNAPGRVCYGLQRQQEVSSLPGVTFRSCDLGDLEQAKNLVRQLLDPVTWADRGQRVAAVTLVHAVGPFKYEGYKERDEHHEIDPHVLRMNDEAFENMADTILASVAEDTRVNLCTFGSVSEPHEIPLWFSFNEAKKRVRHYIQSTVEKYKTAVGTDVSGLYIRTSTINTDRENNIRPHAPEDVKKYWLEAGDVAEKFCECLEGLQAGEFQTTDLIRPVPGFDPETYYDVENLDRRWRSMMNPGLP